MNIAEAKKRVRALVVRQAHPSRVGFVLPGKWVDELASKLEDFVWQAMNDAYDQGCADTENEPNPDRVAD